MQGSVGSLNEYYRRSGMSDTIGTEAIVGGYFNSIVFLGEFLGPVIGGCLIDKYQNIVTATSIFGFGALVAVSNWQTSWLNQPRGLRS